MKRLVQCISILSLLLASGALTFAQQAAQPVVRLGNWIEIGNEVFMDIIAAADIRYLTVQNRDFESRVRDRSHAREVNSAPSRESDSDITQAELRFGANFRYQKSLEAQILFESQAIFDGNTIDDRQNSTTPGGTDVFGRPAVSENNGTHIERYWIDYTFLGTPLRMRVGADLWRLDQAGIVGDDDPRFAVFAKFGNLDLTAAAVVQFESQRLGLENDNDLIYYTFSAGYDFKPHRAQLDVVYYRDRFSGADTSAVNNRGGDVGFAGQKHDSVLIIGSVSGKLGPVRGLVQGMGILGTARGGTVPAGLPAGVRPGREYDIFAAGVIAYAEADLGVVRPFVGLVFGTGDGNPRDDQLHGFAVSPYRTNSVITGTTWFSHLDVSSAFAARDTACPARIGSSNGATPLRTGLTRSAENVGVVALGTTSGNTECAHSESFPFNNRWGNTSHLGLESAYSSPGTLVIPAGLRVFPIKGHEMQGYYVYRSVAETALLDIAFAPDLAASGRRNIRKTQYHGIGGTWQWTLNPHFDIRLTGEVILPGEGYKDLARLGNCNPSGAFQACDGDDPALRAEARFRARF